ncbi:MAG: RagB/SusD family nutrient uptake outer membrane protein [Phaeodactylibacter sp.]|nr:RagB/SusD family nutrient uptake outer membrane protein [Phaeodactylibacter sp.]
MKHNQYLKIVLIGLLAITSSCESFLEEEVIDEISVDYIYSTPGGLEVGVNALYNLQRRNNYPEYEGDPLRANVFFLAGTDLGLTRTWHRPYGAGHTAASFAGARIKWELSYQIIDRANALIISARGIDMDEKEKNELVAQARLIRGELYLDLIRMFDNILLDTTATTPENAFDPITYTVADPKAVYALINSDLDFAIENLEWVVPYGRYGQGAARHIRGKAAMWQEDWAEAARQFDAIVEDGTHYLLSDIRQVFGQNVNHAESLFNYVKDLDLGGNDNLAGGGGTWLSSVFNNRAYELSSGEVISSVEYGGQALGWSFPNDYLQSLYDQENDKRYTTYYYPLIKYVNNPDKPNFGEPLPESSYDDNFRRHHWSLKKFHDEEKPTDTNDSFKDLIYYRFAETLLLGAEAHWHLSGSDADPKALEYINRIRERAGVPPFTNFTLDTYLEESARELAFEKNRWFLLKRLGLLVERQSEHYRYGSNSTNVVPEPMAPHMVRLPIPQNQIDLMGTFPQNPGY